MSTDIPAGLPPHLRRRSAWGGPPPREPRPAAPVLRVALDDPEAQMPLQERTGDAGMDLYVSQAVTIGVGEFVDVESGLRLQLPAGYWARITGRSSTLRQRGLLVNEAVIDGGYIGPIYAGVFNLGQRPVDVAVGERLAQLILHPIVRARTEAAHVLISTDGRGVAGFGSSGR